jgi:hypothetical protein
MGFASLHVLVLGLLTPQLIGALALQPRQVSCDFSVAANTGDTCASFAAGWGLTVSAFTAINPGVTCPNLVGGTSYCVIGTAPATTAATTAATSTKAATTTSTSIKAATTTSTSIKAVTTSTTTTATSSLPSPTQSGLTSNCNNFHKVITDDSCTVIEDEYGIPAATFSAWNPAIDSGK